MLVNFKAADPMHTLAQAARASAAELRSSCIPGCVFTAAVTLKPCAGYHTVRDINQENESAQCSQAAILVGQVLLLTCRSPLEGT